MRKHVKQIACALMMSFLVSSMAPVSQTAYADTRKEFTYAEQVSGAKVTSLNMIKGEKVDLKFKGVPDYKSYTLKWSSSNTAVAVVDSSGVITAVGNGIATITLKIGDGTKYTSTGVIVTVGATPTQSAAAQIRIGTALNNTQYYYSIGLKQSLDLNAYAGMELPASSYIYNWTSTNTAVATIDANGKVIPKSSGITVIQLTLTNRNNGKSMSAVPVAIQVGTTTTVGTVPTATPTPTKAPTVTATPTPNPNATPAPSTSYVPYSVMVSSDHSVTLQFTKKVSFDVDDVKLYQVLSMGNDSVEVRVDVAEATLNSTATEMVVEAEDFFNSGDKYMIKVGPADNGKSFSVNFGEPDRMELAYSCMGKEWTAYAYDDEVGLDVPVLLTYRLYDGTVDVTESYIDKGYAYFDMIAPSSSEYVNLNGEQIYFYASNVTAVIQATYSYTDDQGIDRTITDNVNITARKLDDYSVTSLVEWTIIDENDKTFTKIDWSKPVHKAITGADGYTVAALLKDSYGYYYSTDPRGVDESENIYFIEDEETLFAYQGYSYAFNATDSDRFILTEDGDLYPYEATSKAVGYVTLYNDMKWSSGKKDLAAFQMQFLEESRLASMKIEESAVSLLTMAENNAERFCQIDIPILLYDQYGNAWKGDADFNITCTTTEIKNALDGSADSPATIETGINPGEYYLHVDAWNIKETGTTRSSISLTVTETETKKKDSVTINLQKPTTNSSGNIVINNWNVGMPTTKFTFGDGNLHELEAKAVIEIYQISKNGMKVGLFMDDQVDENDNDTEIILLDEKQSFTSKNCSEGEIYVLVQGPDNSVVERATTEDSLGVWKDSSTGMITVNVSEVDEDTNTISCLEPGKYTVTVTRITKIDGTRVTKPEKSVYFTVTDNSKDVTLRGIKSAQTELTVNGEDDLEGISAIIEELFLFNLGNEVWKDMTAEMITAVEYTPTKTTGYVRITSIEFAVPADGKTMDEDTPRYKKVVKKVNKTILTGAYDD